MHLHLSAYLDCPDLEIHLGEAFRGPSVEFPRALVAHLAVHLPHQRLRPYRVGDWYAAGGLSYYFDRDGSLHLTVGSLSRAHFRLTIQPRQVRPFVRALREYLAPHPPLDFPEADGYWFWSTDIPDDARPLWRPQPLDWRRSGF